MGAVGVGCLVVAIDTSIVEANSLVVVVTTGVSVATTPEDETGTMEEGVWGVGVHTPVSVVTGGGGGADGVVSDCRGGGVCKSDLLSFTSGGGGGATQEKNARNR